MEKRIELTKEQIIKILNDFAKSEENDGFNLCDQDTYYQNINDDTIKSQYIRIGKYMFYMKKEMALLRCWYEKKWYQINHTNYREYYPSPFTQYYNEELNTSFTHNVFIEAITDYYNQFNDSYKTKFLNIIK